MEELTWPTHSLYTSRECRCILTAGWVCRVLDEFDMTSVRLGRCRKAEMKCYPEMKV